jgi:hypothetical protein
VPFRHNDTGAEITIRDHALLTVRRLPSCNLPLLDWDPWYAGRIGNQLISHIHMNQILG